MLDFKSPLARRVNRCLRQEQFIWLIRTAVPNPGQSGFTGTAGTVLIFSARHTAKVQHIARNRNFALSLNTRKNGDST